MKGKFYLLLILPALLICLSAISWTPIKEVPKKKEVKSKRAFPAPGTVVYPQGYTAGQYPLCDLHDGEPHLPYSYSYQWYFQASTVLFLIGPIDNPTCAYIKLNNPVVPGDYYVSWPVAALIY